MELSEVWIRGEVFDMNDGIISFTEEELKGFMDYWEKKVISENL